MALPMPEADFVDAAVASDKHGVAGEYDANELPWSRPNMKRWPRKRVEAFDRDPMFAICDRHIGSIRAINADDIPRKVRVPQIVMHRQTWNSPSTGDAHIWIGQCKDCGTIYYAIKEPTTTAPCGPSA